MTMHLSVFALVPNASTTEVEVALRITTASNQLSRLEVDYAEL